MLNYNISTKRLRYIIPFEFNVENTSFEDIIKTVDEHIDYPYSFLGNKNENYQSKWIRKSLKNLNQDVYGYIIDEYTLLGDINKEELISKTGVYWHYDLFEEDPFVLYYDKQIPLYIVDMGMFIFRSGVGLLWYEVDLRDNFNTSLDLIEFQNKFKQLDRAFDVHTYIKKDKFNIDTDEEYIPFLLANFFAERLSFLNIRYQAERKNTYSSLIKKHIKNDYHFPEYCPDKAILFSYVVYERNNDWKKDDNSLRTAYYTNNGYKESYEMSDEIKDLVANPFSNVYWLASKEGASYIAWQNESNADFFINHQYFKVIDDYFLLFIRALYQSFSLMKYSVFTSKMLSSDYREYIKVSDNTEKLYDDISSIEAEINLFLVKSMATSVSHIQHQNEFYTYLIDRLKVKEDVSSVTAGLSVLNDMQNDTFNKKQRIIEAKAEKREKEADNKFQIGLGLVTFLAAISAITDAYGLVEGLANNTLTGLSIIIFAVLCIICIVILIASVILFVSTVKQFKKR